MTNLGCDGRQPSVPIRAPAAVPGMLVISGDALNSKWSRHRRQAGDASLSTSEASATSTGIWEGFPRRNALRMLAPQRTTRRSGDLVRQGLRKITRRTEKQAGPQRKRKYMKGQQQKCRQVLYLVLRCCVLMADGDIAARMHSARPTLVLHLKHAIFQEEDPYACYASRKVCDKPNTGDLAIAMKS